MPRVQLLAARDIAAGELRCRIERADGLSRVHRQRAGERHLLHLVVGTLARLARLLLALGTRERPGPPERVQIGDEIAGVLTRSIGGAIEQGGVTGHHRVGHHGARREQVHVLPVDAACPALAAQIRADTARAPEMRGVATCLPRQRGRAEALHVRREIANLLRVTVRAALARVDGAAALLGGGRLEGFRRRHRGRLAFELARRPGAEQCHRQREEGHTRHRRDEVGRAECVAVPGAHIASVAARRGATGVSAAGVAVVRVATPAPRGPVVRPASSATNEAVRMLPMCARPTQ